MRKKKGTRALVSRFMNKIAKPKRSTRALSSGFMNKQILNSKRSQFKIQQMAFMLLAVVLFFILVALFWLSFQYRNLEKTATELEKEKSILLAEALYGSSEFSCSREMGAYCIDTDKLIVLQDKAIYKDLWPVSYIKIRKIYPLQEDKECTKINYPNCSVFNVYGEEEGAGIGSFIALCRHENVNNYPIIICELGKIIIGYKVK